MNPEKIQYATGRRKEAVARVWLREGEKSFEVNGKPLEGYFPREADQLRVKEPLKAANFLERFGVRAHLEGGGKRGQIGALRLGLARALLKFDEALRPLLRKQGFLTRDPRVKERKKFGRKGARRSFQYTKR